VCCSCKVWYEGYEGSLFLPLAITKAGWTLRHCILRRKARSPRLLLPSTRWCKTMMWRRGSKCRYGCFSTSFAISRSPTVPSLMHMTLKFSRRACLTRTVNRTPTFAPFATADFHIICKRYLEQTSSHLIGKLKSFVEVNLQDSSSAPHPLSDADDGSLVGR
jgi:hypothetical protein